MAKVSLRTYNREIESMLDHGQLDEVVAHCHHILKSFPKHLETYRLLGKAYLELKKYGDAVDIFSRVLVSVPNDFVAHVGMSIIRDEENKLDDAIWHMERAFETQPSNAAIQGELQRLYGRRDGVQPPRIRMTRGALANMYVQGELYPQAISEIKGVLAEDPGRSDMQSLLARACYRSGQKNEAAEVASTLLRTYPYSLDANRVLVEILGVDRSEAVQPYRQRVIELDPYAAHVTGSIFQSNDAPDSAITLDRLDWNNQPVEQQADWRTNQGIESDADTANGKQPDWLRGGFEDTNAAPPSPPAGAPVLDSSPSTEENLPDFLREAGWEKSTGAFNEGMPPVADEDTIPPTQAVPIAEGDLPDWVRAMAPPEVSKPAEEEDLPDWISKIGTGVLATPSDSTSMPSDQPGPFLEPGGDQPDWLKQLGQDEQQPAPSVFASDDQPDWISKIGTGVLATPSDSTSMTPDQPAPFIEPADDQLDWLKPLGQHEQQPAPPAFTSDDQPDWLKQFGGEPEPVKAEPSSNDFAFLNELKMEEPLLPSFPAIPRKIDTGDLGKSEQERDDSFAWLENLAAKQGATEGLLTKPEERLAEEPEWVKQAKGLSEQQPVEQPVVPGSTGEVVIQPVGNIDDLVRSEQERDDSFALPENLAVEDGATEGLLTKPGDRLQQEPEGEEQAEEIEGGQATIPPMGEGLVSSIDTAAWLRSLDQEESNQMPVTESAGDDTAMWLRSLDEAEAKPEPVVESSNDDTAMWLKSLDEPESTPIELSGSTSDLPAWMQSVDEEKTASITETAIPASDMTADIRATDVQESIESKEEPETFDARRVDTGSLPSWLRGLDEEKTNVPAAQDDLPAWLRDETVETAAEPENIEPTRSTDWQPVNAVSPESDSFVEPEEVPAPPPKPKKPAHKKSESRPVTPVETYREPLTRKGAGTLTQSVDMLLGLARNELSRSNIPGALETYAKLIKRGRFLEEVIFDLREALYRYPVEVSIWELLGDAYMRANRLQDALDAYTKAEELLR